MSDIQLNTLKDLQIKTGRLAGPVVQIPELKTCLELKAKTSTSEYATIWRHPMLDDYEVLEYLGSSGELYINTQYILTLNQKCRITVDYLNLGESGCVCGAGQNDTWTAWIGYNGSIYTPDNTSIDIGSNLRTVIDVYYDNNKVYYLNTELSYSNNLNTATPLYIFASLAGDRNQIVAMSSIKLYNLKYYDGDTLVRHLIPVLHKSDLKPGMYDLVTNTFFTNQGTGSDFNYGVIGGGKIPKCVLQVEYLESTGAVDGIGTAYFNNGTGEFKTNLDL